MGAIGSGSAGLTFVEEPRLGVGVAVAHLVGIVAGLLHAARALVAAGRRPAPVRLLPSPAVHPPRRVWQL